MSAQKLGGNGDKMQGVHVDFEVFFSPIGLSNDKHSVTENILLQVSVVRYSSSCAKT